MVGVGRRLWVLGLIVAVVAGCDLSTVGPTASAPFSQTDIVVGTGAEATNGKVLTVRYSGWLYDPVGTDRKGLLFDTSTGTDPFVFTLGEGQVIDGWDQGLVGMRAGGVRRLIIPPSLAYGDTRRGSIPPNSTLVFDVELTAVE